MRSQRVLSVLLRSGWNGRQPISPIRALTRPSDTFSPVRSGGEGRGEWARGLVANVRYFWIILAAIHPLLAATALCQTAANTQPAASKWEDAIQAFESADRTNPPPRDAILFIGSSSIRRWTSLAADFAEFKVFNRGFGGSQIADSIAFAPRIVIPYRPKMICLYAGDNDLAAGKSPERVFADFKEFVRTVHDALPETRIVFITIKPSPAREKLLEQARAANQLVRDYCDADERLVYADVFTPMLDAAGKPRAELFVKDMLHTNEAGYALWTSVLRPVLDRHAPPETRAGPGAK